MQAGRQAVALCVSCERAPAGLSLFSVHRRRWSGLCMQMRLLSNIANASVTLCCSRITQYTPSTTTNALLFDIAAEIHPLAVLGVWC